MLIDAITISGFKSFAEEQELEFGDHPGFWLVKGKNLVEPTLGANGAGKSTLFDALVWCLYGKTARGVRGPAVESWEGEELTCVRVHARIQDKAYVFERRRNPNHLGVAALDSGEELQTYTDEQVVELVGVSYEQFLNTVVLGQFNQFFFDQRSSERLDTFSEMLNLQVWEDARARARKVRDRADGFMRKLEADCARLSGALQHLDAEIPRVEELADKHDVDKHQEVAALEGRLLEQNGRVQVAEDNLHALRPPRPANTRAVDEWKAAIDTTEKERFAAVQALADAQSALRVLHDHINRLRGLGASCPTCEQSVDRLHVDAALEDLHRKLQDAELDFQECQERLDTCSEQLENQRRALSKAQSAVDKHNQASAELRREQQLLEQRLQTARERAAEIDAEIERVRKRPNPHHDALRRLCEQADAAEVRMQELDAQLKDYAEEHSAAKFWIDEFPKIRMWLIDQATNEMQLIANNVLPELGLHGWEIELSTERANKTKGTTRGFHVMIKSPGSGSESVPWEAWSGGETQRLRIAGALALQRLVELQTGFWCNLEVWDEPTAHLGEQGIQDLVSFLGQRPRMQLKDVWLVDHRTLSCGEFTGEITVEKRPEGSVIVR